MASDARGAAYLVLRRTFEQGAFTDRAFHTAAVGLRGRDRALAMRLSYGAVQRALTLDHLIEQCAARPVAKIDAPLLAALRLGAYELCFADSAPYAVVNHAVELAKGARGHALVNAVLRRLAREGAALLATLGDENPARAAICHSMPLWIVEMWWQSLGAQSTRALLHCANEPAESALRANTLRTDAPGLVVALAASGISATCAGDPPEAVLLGGAFDAHGSALWRAGALMPQSRASMLVAHCVGPRPGERVLDMCAAPGGKTTHMAALMGARGEIVALERHGGRAQALERTAQRMGADNVTVVVADAAAPRRPGAALRARAAGCPLLRARHAGCRAPTCAGAPARSACGRSPRSRPGYCPLQPPPARRELRSSTRPARSPRPRTSSRSEPSSMLTPSSHRPTFSPRTQRGPTRTPATSCSRSPTVRAATASSSQRWRGRAAERGRR